MKKLAIGLGVLVALVVGVGVYLLMNQGGDADQFSRFGYENDAVPEENINTEDSFFDDDSDAEILEAETFEAEETGIDDGENGDGSSSDGSGGSSSLGRSGGSSGFAPISTPSDPIVSNQGAPRTQGNLLGTGSGGGTTGGGGTGGTLPPPPAVLTILSPQAGDTLSNAGTCSYNNVDDEGNEAPCTSRRPIGDILWTYDDPLAKITIQVRGGGSLRTLASNIRNEQRFTWEYDPTVTSGDYVAIVTARTVDGELLATRESGTFEVVRTGGPSIGTPPGGPTIACPAVPSRVRTVTPTNLGSEGNRFYCTTANGGCWNQIELRHYRYPETVTVGEYSFFHERCALTATPGSRTCPYANSIYANSEEINNYSIYVRSPDALNDQSEVGDRVFHAYLKPIIGPSRANKTFDMSIPFKIADGNAGKFYDFNYSGNAANLAFEGQYAISECEGDFSERAIRTEFFNQQIRFNVRATDGLEGSLTQLGRSDEWNALKVGKTYYLNIRLVKTSPAPGGTYTGANCILSATGTCLSPFASTDLIPDSGIHDHAVARQLMKASSVGGNDFYRWDFSSNPSAYFGGNVPSENDLRNNPLFDTPGGVSLSPLYYPSCSAGAGVSNGIRGSNCEIVCKTGYEVNSGNTACVRQ